MAEAVLEDVVAQLTKHVLGSLNSTDAPFKRLANMLDATDQFYNGGNDLCFISIFAIGMNSQSVSEMLHNAVGGWLESLALTLKDAGKPDSQSLANAGLSCIQGGLVLSVVTKDPAPFKDALKFLRGIWL